MAEVRITGVVLEHVAQKDRKDESKVYHSLFVYEQGQKYRRTLTEIKVPIDKVSAASKCEGKVCTIVTDLSTFGDKNTFYFQSVA